MIPTIGVMLGLFIITRMVEVLFSNAIIVKLCAAVTLIFTVFAVVYFLDVGSPHGSDLH